MRITNVLLFMLMLFISKISLGQEKKIILQSDYMMYIKVSDIYKADKNNILKKEIELYNESDSLICLELGGYYWLKFACDKDEKNHIIGRIIAVNREHSRVHFVGEMVVDMRYRDNTVVDELYKVFGQLFYIRLCEIDYIKGNIGYNKISLIDIDNMKIKKEISLEYGAWKEDLYINRDTLIIELQPMKLRRNYFYEFRWLFREETMKYFIEDDGSKIRLLFDKDFNYIRKIKLE